MKNEKYPNTACKKAGLKNLKELSRITGQSSQTLGNWFKSENETKRRQFYDAVVGALIEEKKAVLLSMEEYKALVRRGCGE